MNNMMVYLGSVVLVVTVLLGIVWQFRTRARRRFSAALNAHADREIAETQRFGPRRYARFAVLADESES
jgi:hypothetical protein